MTDSPVTQPAATWAPAVHQAARDFAKALARTPEYAAFAQAHEAFMQDEETQQAVRAYQDRLQSLQGRLSRRALTAEENAGLESLLEAALCRPSLAHYSAAQADLKHLCQALADRLSAQVGLDFAGAGCSGCSGGCG
jgi:cell fate (sporulation/competence/biofilm development) regulator YlbF (YheA/YmcA/DUF963 family)